MAAALSAATMSGKFILVDGDDDNFDKIMAAVGMSAEHIELSRRTKPTIEYTRDVARNSYQTTISAPGMPQRTQNFKLDVEFEEVAIGGRKVKSTFKRVEMLIHEEKQADGQVVVTERQIKGDEMHVKVTLNDLVAHRIYKRIV